MLREGVRVRLGLVRQPAAHVVGGDDPVRGAERGDQGPVVEGPGRVAVEHDERIAGPFIDIVVLPARERQVLGTKRVEVPEGHHAAYQTTPSIMQFRPLPMPSRATFSARLTCPASMLSAIVIGRDAEPMLPRNSTVG